MSDAVLRKVVVVDCDNTLWGDVVGEVGPEGVSFGEQHRALHVTLARLSEAGILVCLASKNAEADVWAVFDTRRDFGLSRSAITAAMLNWMPKSANLRTLATRFNLPLESFVFLDDNPLECAEVRGQCPGVLVLEWPKSRERALQLLVLLDRLWEDALPTDEDRGRAQMYRENELRRAAQEQAPSLSAFFAGLGMVVESTPVTAENVRRAAQLTQRTNQFNFTTIRRSEAELTVLLASGRYEGRVFSARDRFGDHGIIGLFIVERAATVLFVDTFLLSCRVLGRGIEHRMLTEIGRMAAEFGLGAVKLRVVPTEKNEPARLFFKSVAGEAGAAVLLDAFDAFGAWECWLTTNRFVVYQAFADVLGLLPEQVAEIDRFDALGCDSLKAVQVTTILLGAFPNLPATFLFEHHSVSGVVRYVDSGGSTRVHTSGLPRSSVTGLANTTDIAVVGMGVRCAGADTPEELWRIVSNGETEVRVVPEGRTAFFGKLVDERPHYAGLLRDPSLFDARFFHVSPREARFMDPQQRLFLEVAWEALEDAGTTTENLIRGTDVGVFVGSMYSDYVYRANAVGGLYRCWEGFSWANRVSQVFGFSGPSMAVDTACSSSATALYIACRALRAGDCSAAVVGGVNLILDPARFDQLGHMGILSPSGNCRPFSKGADGTVLGEGVGVVVLRPLAEAVRSGDRVYGVVKGVGTSVGAGALGFTTPSPGAQAEAVRRALREACVDPRSVGYVEAHGTGTPVGDPIEVRGLTMAYTDGVEWGGQRCRLGAIKPNIGHLEAGAGVVGLIKVLLQFQHGMLAPMLGYIGPNPQIPADAPFDVQMKLEPWTPQTGLRRAGISSFGVGGSNVHIIVEEPNASVSNSGHVRPRRAWQHERFWL